MTADCANKSARTLVVVNGAAAKQHAHSQQLGRYSEANLLLQCPDSAASAWQTTPKTMPAHPLPSTPPPTCLLAKSAWCAPCASSIPPVSCTVSAHSGAVDVAHAGEGAQCKWYCCAGCEGGRRAMCTHQLSIAILDAWSEENTQPRTHAPHRHPERPVSKHTTTHTHAHRLQPRGRAVHVGK